MSFDLGSIVSTVVSLAVTYFTGNPALGQMAGQLASSLMSSANGESGASGNMDFSKIFNANYGQA